MSETWRFAIGHATDDVRATFSWLEANGFVRTAEWGGGGAPFGSVCIDFSRGDLRLRIVRDRGQWGINIASPGGELMLVDTLLSVSPGADLERGDDSTKVDQLPRGVVWMTEIPRLIGWLEEHDRMPELLASQNVGDRSCATHDTHADALSCPRLGAGQLSVGGPGRGASFRSIADDVQAAQKRASRSTRAKYPACPGLRHQLPLRGPCLSRHKTGVCADLAHILPTGF